MWWSNTYLIIQISVLSPVASHNTTNLYPLHCLKRTCWKVQWHKTSCFAVFFLSWDVPRTFSSCSTNSYEQYQMRRNPSCMLNKPDYKTLVAAAVCGNGFLEQGEQCDCGTVEVNKHSNSHSRLTLLNLEQTLHDLIWWLTTFVFYKSPISIKDS